MTANMIWLVVLLSLTETRGQTFEERHRSFSVFNMTDGHPGCALDVPDKILLLDQRFSGAVCPAVVCAWECKMDLRCLEFNFHSNNMTCDLFYRQPVNYQNAAGCAHFKVRVIEIIFHAAVSICYYYFLSPQYHAPGVIEY